MSKLRMEKKPSHSQDRHKTQKLARILAIVVSALFAAVAVAGFNRTGDYLQLGVFLVVSIVAYFVIVFIFKGVDRLLDSVDDREH
ncbi:MULTISPECIES: hypothetical protein [Neptunomonas]|nr:MULTISPECIES: hypothetical protein [Neptunomonas]MDO6469467.1 hypothetical protein [Neptunomonas phycophila]